MEPLRKGRRRFQVDRGTLERYRSLKFTWDQIGSLLGTSGKTIQRRAKEWNIESYSSITNAALDDLVRRIVSDFPNAGEVLIQGHLMSQKVSYFWFWHLISFAVSKGNLSGSATG